ncbi:60s acidic ribosomal protein-domain-containing protein [Gymnopilus junonius]|uniref:60s acidic ribosomal protein-domain-containing protein n=1 Tax=Gymnopilus junonius TaxID=109634 RepID=A0A9P5NYU2_GYMJU|nr:60s acidic ribosomal protein-domain-containing protein [Gymnopilus junonius]
MRNIAAYLLLQTGGKENPTADDIKKLLAVVGIETDEERLNTLISELQASLLLRSTKNIAQVPSGGAGGAVAAAPAAAGGAPAAAAERRRKRRLKRRYEESDDDMGFGLFD